MSCVAETLVAEYSVFLGRYTPEAHLLAALTAHDSTGEPAMSGGEADEAHRVPGHEKKNQRRQHLV